jgi:hypothetical protein
MKQPLANGKLRALVNATILGEEKDAYTVSIVNEGNEEVFEVNKVD